MNRAIITVPIDVLDFHDFMLKNGIHLVKCVNPINQEKNTKFGVPEIGDCLRHYSGVMARIRDIGKDAYGKYLIVTNYTLDSATFQGIFFDYKSIN